MRFELKTVKVVEDDDKMAFCALARRDVKFFSSERSWSAP